MNANKIPARRREAFCVRSLNRAFTAVVKGINATKDEEIQTQMRDCYELVRSTYKTALQKHGTDHGTLKSVLREHPRFVQDIEAACNAMRATSSSVRNAGRYNHTWPEANSAPVSSVEDIGHI